MRLFTAIDLPEEIRDRIDTLIARLRPSARVTWSPASNLHITTKFIGELREERLPELERALKSVATRETIPIRVSGLGFFPNAKSPKVFWAGVKAPAELTTLARETDEATAKIGVPREARAYSPHLTLARIRDSAGVGGLLSEVAKAGEPDFGSFDADRFHLYLSKLSPQGSVYTKLSEFPFLTS